MNTNEITAGRRVLPLLKTRLTGAFLLFAATIVLQAMFALGLLTLVLPAPKAAIAETVGDLLTASDNDASQNKPAAPNTQTRDAQTRDTQTRLALPAKTLPTSAMLILDGSGSMWGRIEKKPKIVIMREVLGPALKRLGEKTRLPLGLMAYGHRRKSSCLDIQTLVPPQPVSADQHIKRMMRILPRGKTPIEQSLRQAWRTLYPAAQQDKSQSAAIVLFTDGSDNCRRDPCRLAEQLKQKTPGLKIHVIAFNLKPEDQNRVRCLAQATGGLFRPASNIAVLTSAVDEVFKALWYVAPPPEKLAAKKKTAPAAPKPQPPELQLSASLDANGPLLTRGITWYIAPLASKMKGLETVKQAQPRLKLAPGAYYVEAVAGQARVIQEVTIKPAGPTRVHVNLAAGRLLIAPVGLDLPGITPPVQIRLTSLKTDQKTTTTRPGDTPQQLVQTANGKLADILPAGRYRLQIRLGNSLYTRQIKLNAGDNLILAPPLQAGLLALNTTATPIPQGYQTITMTWYQLQPETSQLPRGEDKPHLTLLSPFIQTAARQPVWVVPAGRYRLTVIDGPMRASQSVVIRQNAISNANIASTSARLLLSARIKGERKDLLQYLRYRIERLPETTPDRSADEADNTSTDRPHTEPVPQGASPIETSLPKPAIDLPPGRYKITAWLGQSGARTGSVITLAAGQQQRLSLTFNVGVLNLSAARRSNPKYPARDVFWQIRDRSGRLVRETAIAEPMAIISAGPVQILADIGGQQIGRQVQVKPGQRLNIRLISAAQ